MNELSKTIKERNRSESPKKALKYNKTINIRNNINVNHLISNEPLFSLKETFICVFCGGKNCKHENYRLHKNPAIEGLNSDKIDDNIYASQRPANSLIKEFNLISKFKELNIGFIVNLQLPGEHPYCGPIDKLDESGFSYSPSLFESEGIHVGLYGWKDMNIPNSLNHMLEIVKSMYYYIHYLKKKVLVHCHAGYGRTGITIACYKIFDECISAQVAKTEIRKIRPKCIQSKEQLLYCINFQEFIRRLKGNFYLKEKRNIENYIKYQNDLNVGKYNFNHFSYNKSVPLFLIYIFDSIIDIKNKNNLDDYSLYKCLNRSYIMQDGDELIDIIEKNINKYNWDILYSCEEPIILGELLYMWLQNSIEYVIDPKNISEINEDFSDFGKILKTCEYQTILLIIKFLSLIKNDSEEEEETLTEKNNFIKILSNHLLGYSLDEKELKNNEIENIDKLIKLINFIEDKQKNENIDLEYKEEDKEKILSDVYEQLKNYFENKTHYNDNKKPNLLQMDSNNLLMSINNIINKKDKKFEKISNEDLNNNNKKQETEGSIKGSINIVKKPIRPPRLGITKSYNFNINNMKLSKSYLSIKENKNSFQNSYKAINEIEEEKDIPWIREEDC
jgi:hypothetical protein